MELQIVAMGGGGFATEPENLLLEQYVLSLSRNRIKPRVCFLPTASGDSENYIERFYTSFGKLDAVPSHLPLFGLTVRDIRAFLLEQDVIYIGGGNNDSEAGRRPAYHHLVVNGALPSGYAADDGVGLHFFGTQLAQIVSSRVDARAYEVRLSDLELIETELLPRYLGQ